MAFLKPGLHETVPVPPHGWAERWPNFQPAELACKCNGRFCDHSYWHDEEFLDALQELRLAMDCPLRINSGHRCEEWNAMVGGAVPTATSPGSWHLRIAVDIALGNIDRRWRLHTWAVDCGFTGIGFGLMFLHLDRRPKRASWDYGQASRLAWKLDR